LGRLDKLKAEIIGGPSGAPAHLLHRVCRAVGLRSHRRKFLGSRRTYAIKPTPCFTRLHLYIFKVALKLLKISAGLVAFDL
jgi:hypothetical protein